MKSLPNMKLEKRRILRRALAIVLSVALVAGLGLSYSPDRVLKAEEITAEEMQAEKTESSEASVKIEEPAKESAPAPAETQTEAPSNVVAEEELVISGGEESQTKSSGSAEEPAGTSGDEQAEVTEAPEVTEEADKEDGTWTVTFYNRDAEVHKTVKVTKGETLGSDLPDTISRDDYRAYWAVGEIVQGGQGKEIRVTGGRVTGSFRPDRDTVVVPDYEKITYTVTFHDREGGSVIEDGVKTVDADTSYCLNDIPQVPVKDGYAGKWAYSGGNFNNTVRVNRNTDVWAVYDQNVFTVEFTVEGSTYRTDTYFSGDKLDLPSDPVVEGKTFAGWFAGDTEIKGGESVTSNMTISASFSDRYQVNFVIETEEGEVERLSQYFRADGEAIGTMPQDPFIAGRIFEKWVDAGSGADITADTVVDRNITAKAQFRELGIYNIRVEYYYTSDRGSEVIFSTDLLQAEAHELPYTITAPYTIQTDPNQVSGAPVYYAETPSVTVDKKAFSGNEAVVRVKYVKYTAVYDFVYLLKDLSGDGYTEIGRTSGVQGVLNSYVTPVVKSFDNAVLELAEGAVITKTSGQELNVYYTRRNVQLTYETNGGSYVAGTTAPYGSSVALPAADPVREGYKFAGWYSDASLTQKVNGRVTLNGDTTLYAKWTGETVNYTIVYMCEKFNDTGTSTPFVYDNSKTATAQTGSTVWAANAPSYSKAYYEADTTQNATSSVEIAADGSSVLKVYYRLKTYKIEFNLNNNSSSTTMKKDGTTYKGNSSTRYSINVKLGQSLAGLWPTTDNATFNRNYYSFVGWRTGSNNGTTYVTKQTYVTDELLPSSGSSVTYYANWQTSTTTYTVNYWLQNADNNDYTLSSEYSQTLNAQKNANFTAKTIRGYTNNSSKNTQSGNTYNFYYDRDTYNIDYYHGSDLLRTTGNVKFDAGIDKSPYTWTPTAAQCDVDSDYVFAGWFSNAACQGDPYGFDKMPASNLALYAKWNAPSYTVSFVDGDDTAVQVANSQTVEKYKKASKPANPVKAGSVFDGWYTSAEGGDLFDWNSQITADTTVYAHWAGKNLSYKVQYVDEEGAPVAADKEVSNPNLRVGQEVTEMAIAVAGYRPDEGSKKLILDEENNVITFTYSEKAEVTSYTVRYLIDPSEPGGGARVAADKTVSDVPGETTSVIEVAAAVDYSQLYAGHPELKGIEYHPDEVEKTLVLTADSAQSVLTFYYSSFRHAEVKVHFVDMAGKSIAVDDVQKLKVGKTFTLSRSPMEGWDLKKAVVGTDLGGQEAGAEYKITEAIASGGGLEFTLFYQKKATITAIGASKQYDGTALTLASDLDHQVRVEGLRDGDSLTSVGFDYANADSDDGKGRLKAGVATVTPKDAVIAGPEAADYYAVRYISGTLEVTKINVTVRIEPDRWTGAVYTGEPYQTGFTNPAKGIEDYVIISHDGYKDKYLNDIWTALTAKATYDESAAGQKYYGISETDAGDYTYFENVLTTADLPQDDNYSVGLYVRPGRLHILPAPVTVSTESASKGYDGTPLTNAAAAITGLVATDEDKVTVTGTGSQTEIGTGDNTYSISWGTVNEHNYKIANEALGKLTVTPGSVILTAASGSKTYDGTALTNDAVTASGLPEGFTVEATASGSQTDAGSSANTVNDGWVIKDADGKDVTEKFSVSEKVNGTLTVNKAPAVITTGSASKAYDGKALTSSEAGITGLVNGETATVTATGSQTETGSSTNTCSVEWGTAKAGNYSVTENLGTLTVTDSSAEVVLTAASDSKTYDGTALTNGAVTASGLPEGFTAEATASGSITDAGTTDNVVNEGFVIRNAAGEDRTSSFKNIQTVNGTLTVNKAPLTVTTGSGSKAYDGTALTNSEASVSGLVGEETATAAADGSQTEVGTGSNTYNIEWGTANADNYEITENLGTLTVTENSAAVTLTAASGRKTYDGKALTDASVSASGLPEGFTAEATASGSQTGAGSSPNVVSDVYVIRNAAGEDKTANFTNIVKADGLLTVDKAAVTVTTGSAVKAYDGTALTKDEASITGLVNDETATVTATGTQTEPGSTDNTYSIDWGKTDSNNYSISENLGTLTVSENSAEITLTAASGSKVYDGTALTNDAITTEGLPSGFTAEATVSGSRTDAGESSNVIEGYIIRNADGFDKTANFSNVRTVEGTLTVTKAPATVTTGSASREYNGEALTEATAVIEGLADGETVTIAATGTITDIGSTPNTYGITWDHANADNYELTEKLGTLTVTENKTEVTLTAPSDSKVYDGTALTADGKGEKKIVASGLPEGFTAEAAAEGSQTDAGESTNVIKAGYVIRNAAGEDRTASFTNLKTVDGTLTVTKAPVTITTESASKAYDGTALTNGAVSIDGLVAGETFEVEATGTITEVGSTPNTYSMTWAADDNSFTAKAGNYEVTDNLGTLTITESDVQVVLTAASAGKTYDGSELSDSTVTAAGLPDGFTFEAAASGSITDAGTAANVVSDGYKFFDASGADKTANFTKVEKVDGTLTVNPKAVTISTGDASKAYDGTALTKSDARAEGIVAGETYDLKATGTITEVGSEANTYSMVWAADGNAYTAKASNYSVTDKLGTLTVTTNGAEITLTAASDSKTYDGQPLRNDSVSATGLPEGFTVEAKASGSITDVGSTANTVRSGYSIKDAAGQNRTANFTNVKTVDGTLTVERKKVKVTTGSASKEYDGKALTKADASIMGLAAGEAATITATGSQTEVGEGTNTYEIKWIHSANKDNYQIEEELGTLRVTNNTSEITLTAASGSKAYDGTALTDATVTAAGLPEGFTVAASASGSQTAAGSSANTVDEGYVIRNSDGADRTACFTNVKTAAGTLSVTKRNVSLTSASGEKVYDGIALTDSSITVGGEGFAGTEGAVYNVTGSQKDAGSSANAFTYTLDADTDEGNYEITTSEGTLTVTPVTGKVTVTIREHSGSAMYDGQAKTASGYDVSIDNALYTKDGFTFSGSDSVSGTDAGSYPMEIKAEDFTNTSGNFSNVEFKVEDGTLEIAKRALTMTSASATAVYSGMALFDHTVSVTGDGFTSGEGASYSVTGSQKIAGASENTFTYALNEGTKADNYIITTAFGILTISNRAGDAKYEVTITAASDKVLYDGSEHSVSGFAGGAASGSDIAVSAGGHDYTVSGLSATASGTDAGTYTVPITGTAVVKDEDGSDVTDQFMVNLVPGELVINPRSVVMTSGTATQTYNGKELTDGNVTVTGDGFANGEGAEYNVTGSRTLPGMSENTFTYKLNEGTNKDNYSIKTVFGQLTVKSRDARYGISLRAKSLKDKYDGTEKTVEGFETLDFTVDGNRYSVSGVEASCSATDAGTYPVNVTGTAVVTDAAGNDVTDQFEVTPVAGTLTIEPRTVVMTSAGDSKVYDGTPLTNREVTVTGDGFAKGEGASYSVSGSRLLPGADENTFTYALNEGTKADNYSISTSFGTLTVLNRDAKYEITVRAADAEYLYDGTDKSAEGLVRTDFTVDGNSYTVEGLTAGVTEKDAGRYASPVTGTPVVKDASGNDVSEQFAVSVLPGSLVIKPRTVVMTSGSATHAYNGKELTNNEVTVTGDGFAEGEGASYEVTGSRTIVGVSDNLFTYALNDGTNADNYEISMVYGKLNVTNRDAKYILTMTPNGGSALYDGEEHSVSGFVSTTAEIDGVSYEVSGLTAGASGTDAGTYGVSVTGTPVVTDAAGNDVTEQFSVESKEATLTISPRQVLLRSADESREYDGTPLTGSGEVAIEGDGFVGGDGVIITPTASRTLVGATQNTFDWAFSEGTKDGNYDVSVEYGLLSITNRDASYRIVMKANSDTAEYDGEEHSVSGFEENSFDVEGNRYEVSSVEAGARGIEAGVYTTEISGTAEVKDAEGNDVTDQFAVSYQSGTLTITASDTTGTNTNTGGSNGTGTGTTGGNGGNGLTIETIQDTIPVASAPAGYWALLNLIMTIVTALGAIYMIFRRVRDDDEDEEGEAADVNEQSERSKKRLLPVIAAVLLAIASIIVFIITEDMSNTMALFDKYTLLMALMLIAQIAAAILLKKDEDKEENRKAEA